MSDHQKTVLEHAIDVLIREIGEDPDREGLADTPRRFAKAMLELTSQTNEDPSDVLSTTFAGDGYDQLVVVSDVPFHSLCEHHMLPFSGTVTVGYLPGERVVGLSKIPRLIDGYSKRLQIQERFTRQIADAIDDRLEPAGVGVIVTGHHTCMSMRGVRSSGWMTTSSMLGALRNNPATRAELMSLHTLGGDR